jgi:hypothetical protein
MALAAVEGMKSVISEARAERHREKKKRSDKHEKELAGK